MSLKVTLGQLKNSEEALKSLVAQPLPVVVSFKLGKSVQLIQKELDALEAKRIELVKQYSGKPKPGKELSVTEKNMPKFLNDIGELYRIEVEIQSKKFSIDNFAQAKLSVNDLITLNWLIEDK